MKKRSLLAGGAGALALALLIWRIGVFDIATQLQKLGLVLAVVVAAGAIRLWVQTRAWQLALRAENIDISHSRLAGVRLASQATSYLAAMGPVVSEPTKLMLLGNPSGMTAAAPATLIETSMYWFTTIIVGLAGTLAASLLISKSSILWVSAGIFSVALAVLVARRSFLPPLVTFAGARAPKWLISAAELEQRIRSYRDRCPEAARKVLAFESVAQLLTLAEVAGVLWVLGIRFSIVHVLAIEAAGRMVKILGAWIPGRLGADEGGATASFALLGLATAAGLTLALARRFRDLLWCAAGVVWMAHAASVAVGGANTPAPLCVEGN